MIRRIQKAKEELDLQSNSENLEEVDKITDNSFSSFFKISSAHMRDAETAVQGDSFDDKLFTMYRVGMTTEEYYERCTTKLIRDTNPYKPSKVTKVGLNNNLTNNQIIENREEDEEDNEEQDLYSHASHASHNSMISEARLEVNEYDDSRYYPQPRGNKIAPSPVNNNMKSQPTASEINHLSHERKRKPSRGSVSKRSSIVCTSQGRMRNPQILPIATITKDEDRIGVFEQPKKKKKRKVIRKRVKKKVHKNNEVIELETYMWEGSESQYK